MRVYTCTVSTMASAKPARAHVNAKRANWTLVPLATTKSTYKRGFKVLYKNIHGEEYTIDCYVVSLGLPAQTRQSDSRSPGRGSGHSLSLTLTYRVRRSPATTYQRFF